MNLLVMLANFFLAGGATPPRGDESITFFPTNGRWDAATKEWTLAMHGWVYELEPSSRSRAALLKLFRHALDLDDRDAARFEERARWFLADNERGKRIPIRLGDRDVVSVDSTPDGHFTASLRLSEKEADRLKTPDAWIPYRAALRPGDTRRFEGAVQLIADRGVSIISDIDDTIKISEVRDKRALLANTFQRDFRPVPGMAELYRRFAASGAVFHYVTDSPWQLYPALAEFTAAQGFPKGTFHMARFRWKDESFFNLFTSPAERKFAHIEPLLTTFPTRSFVLVGDTGQKDPEIYAALAHKYPRQVTQIVIRDLDGMETPRLNRVFANLPAGMTHVVRDAARMPRLDWEKK